MASQITSLMIAYSTVYSGTDQRKHQSSASLAFLREFAGDWRNFPHKGPVTRKMFPFDDVIIFSKIAIEVGTWMSSYIPHLSVDVIICPYTELVVLLTEIKFNPIMDK